MRIARAATSKGGRGRKGIFKRVDETPKGGKNRGRMDEVICWKDGKVGRSVEERVTGMAALVSFAGRHSARSKSQRLCFAVALILMFPAVQAIDSLEIVGLIPRLNS